ncbi:MAG TPA: polysaccharide ABC transporter ATP-binding protein [Pyrinomonadaceae bacterium]|jgi:lipopolysaccharide transport system ATP-binding protein
MALETVNLEKISTVTASAAEADTLVSVEDVSKKFCRSLKRSMFYGLRDIGAELSGRSRHSDVLRSGEFWALNGLSFELQRGEALGLVGPNGAGKSTLLRLISGLIKPDTGTLRVRGRVAPLIALGAGFNPILTGRENIYVNMAILGLSRKEIDARFDEVVDFAEIGDALSAPVQTYSSGMAARLGFACAVLTDPDVLLVDEVLSVGDMKFRMKCLRHMGKLLERGTCFILVSHNPHAILTVCPRAIYISQGKVQAAGETASVLSHYEKDTLSTSYDDSNQPLRLPPKSPAESSGLDITSVCFRDEYGNNLGSPLSGKPASISVRCKTHKAMDGINLIVAISNLSLENERVLYLSSHYDGQPMSVVAGDVELQLDLPYCGLSAGLYSAKIVVTEQSVKTLDAVESFRFRVRSDTTAVQNLFYQPREWRVTSLSSDESN